MVASRLLPLYSVQITVRDFRGPNLTDFVMRATSASSRMRVADGFNFTQRVSESVSKLKYFNGSGALTGFWPNPIVSTLFFLAVIDSNK